MLETIDLLVGFWNDLVAMLDNVRVFGVVSFWDVIMGFLICALVAAVFWKGARA